MEHGECTRGKTCGKLILHWRVHGEYIASALVSACGLHEEGMVSVHGECMRSGTGREHGECKLKHGEGLMNA